MNSVEKNNKKDGFSMIHLKTAAEFSRKMRNSDLIIFALLIYRAFIVSNRTFSMSNDLLTVHKIHRSTKLRALVRFEKAGIIRVERHRCKAPIVTLLIKFKFD